MIIESRENRGTNKPLTDIITDKNNTGIGAIFFPLVLLTGIFFLNFTIRIILAPLMPTLLMDMNATPDQAGSFFFISASGYFISLVLSGFISSRLKHKKTILLAAVAAGVTIIFTALSQNLTTLRLGIFVVGLASGLYFPSGFAMLTASVDHKNLGKAIGIHEMAPNFSFLLAPLICEGLLLWASWRSVLVLTGVASIGFGIAFYAFTTTKDFAGEAPNLRSLRPMVETSSFWFLTLLLSLGITGTLGVYTMLPLYLVQAHGMVQAEANTLIILSRILTLPIPFIIGWFTDRFGVKNTLAAVLFLTGLSTLFTGLFTGVALKVIIFCQPVLAVCFFPPAFAALSQMYSAQKRNIAISFISPIAFLLGGGVNPNIIGVLGDNGYFGAGFMIFGGVILMGSLLPFFLNLVQMRD